MARRGAAPNSIIQYLVEKGAKINAANKAGDHTVRSRGGQGRGERRSRHAEAEDDGVDQAAGRRGWQGNREVAKAE